MIVSKFKISRSAVHEWVHKYGGHSTVVNESDERMLRTRDEKYSVLNARIVSWLKEREIAAESVDGH